MGQKAGIVEVLFTLKSIPASQPHTIPIPPLQIWIPLLPVSFQQLLTLAALESSEVRVGLSSFEEGTRNLRVGLSPFELKSRLFQWDLRGFEVAE